MASVFAPTSGIRGSASVVAICFGAAVGDSRAIGLKPTMVVRVLSFVTAALKASLAEVELMIALAREASYHGM